MNDGLRVESVNVGHPQPNPYKTAETTGIAKKPQPAAVEVRDPGSKSSGLGSGLVGDHIGDRKNHGGDEQAVYAFAREDLDHWEAILGCSLGNGAFGENLTTIGLDITESRLGERWRIGADVELEVTGPRIPCSTFRGWMKRKGWLKTFTADARPGAYLRVVTPGAIRTGDPLEVSHRPDHGVTIGLSFRAVTTEPVLLESLLEAGDDLISELREMVHERRTFPAE